MATYTITEVSETYDEWQAKGGPAAGQTFHTYTVRATDPAGETRTFQMNRKPSSGPPSTGEVDASEQPAKGDYPPKLKINYQQVSESQQSQGTQMFSGSGSKDDYWKAREARDIEAQRRMGRAHAQEMALRFIEITGDAKDLRTDDAEITRAYLNGPLRKLTDFFEADVRQVGESE